MLYFSLVPYPYNDDVYFSIDSGGDFQYDVSKLQFLIDGVDVTNYVNWDGYSHLFKVSMKQPSYINLKLVYDGEELIINKIINSGTSNEYETPISDGKIYLNGNHSAKLKNGYTEKIKNTSNIWVKNVGTEEEYSCVFNNTRKLKEIKITKNVSGNFGDKSKSFDFLINIYDDLNEHEQRFSLKHGETKSIQIPENATYKITELNAINSGYDVNIEEKKRRTY